jgi:hypothetical protein
VHLTGKPSVPSANAVDNCSSATLRSHISSSIKTNALRLQTEDAVYFPVIKQVKRAVAQRQKLNASVTQFDS